MKYVLTLKCHCGFIFEVSPPSLHYRCPNCGGLDVDKGWWLDIAKHEWNWHKYLSSFRQNHRNRIKRIEKKFDSAVVRYYENDTRLVLEAQYLIGRRFKTNFYSENTIIFALIDKFFLIEVRYGEHTAIGYGFFEADKFYYWNAGRTNCDDIGNFLHSRVIQEMMRRKINRINGGLYEIKCKPLFHYERP